MLDRHECRVSAALIGGSLQSCEQAIQGEKGNRVGGGGGRMIPGPYGHAPTWPMPARPGERIGVVYVDQEKGTRGFIASWQATIGGKFVFAPYFQFDGVSAAVAWARERADRVRVAIHDADGSTRFFSAGRIPFPDIPGWTPDAAHKGG